MQVDTETLYGPPYFCCRIGDINYSNIKIIFFKAQLNIQSHGCIVLFVCNKNNHFSPHHHLCQSVTMNKVRDG